MHKQSLSNWDSGHLNCIQIYVSGMFWETSTFYGYIQKENIHFSKIEVNAKKPIKCVSKGLYLKAMKAFLKDIDLMNMDNENFVQSRSFEWIK